MDDLIQFIKGHFPTVSKFNIHVSLIERTENYVTIAVSKNGTLNLIDKFIYYSRRGSYIRVHKEKKRYMRIYIQQFEEAQ